MVHSTRLRVNTRYVGVTLKSHQRLNRRPFRPPETYGWVTPYHRVRGVLDLESKPRTSTTKTPLCELHSSNCKCYSWNKKIMKKNRLLGFSLKAVKTDFGGNHKKVTHQRCCIKKDSVCNWNVVKIDAPLEHTSSLGTNARGLNRRKKK